MHADKEKMTRLDDYCQSALAELVRSQRRRSLKPSGREGVEVVRDGRRYVSFSCNDYLGLSQHPAVIAASREALEAGAGAGASRLVTGNHAYYAPLEQALARLKSKEASLVFGSGYLTNLGVIPALVGADDLVIADKLVHACLLDGAQLSGATLKRFRHNDMAHLAQLLAEHRGQYRHALVLVDHVYSMDGDVAPLAEISALCRTQGAWLMADDAHGIGIIATDKQLPVDVWMGTLSKSLGSYGGYVAASNAVIDLLTSKARSLVFSTGLPPASCAAALAALQVIEREPERAARAVANANRVRLALGLAPEATTIVPVMLGTEERALAVSVALQEKGLLAVAIRPPTVPPGTARLRLAFSCDHTDAQIDQLIAALKEEGIGG